MIRLEDLAKSYGKRPLFAELNYQFPSQDCIALIGSNGAGKTTLLRILTGEIDADGGKVVKPQGLRLGYLPQEPNPHPAPTVTEECMAGASHLKALQKIMDDASEKYAESEEHALIFAEAEASFAQQGGYALESRALELLTGLGFSKKMTEQSPTELSGGWRMRIELSKIFISDPNFLILDEPTNHLDLPSLIWVENYLKKFPGTVLFVSHDRALLNRLAKTTLHIHGQNMTPYKGNFDAFLTQFEERVGQSKAQLANLERRREELQKFVDRFGAKASKAAQAQSRVKMIDKIREIEDGIHVPENEARVGFKLTIKNRSPREILNIIDGSIGYDLPLASKIEMKIERGMKVAVIGANGIGKSTLLKTIAGKVKPLHGQFQITDNVDMGFFAQDQLEILDPNRTVLENLLAADNDLGEPKARSLLGQFLFRGDDVFKKAGVLSGGEKSRLALARVLAKSGNFLMLDEPTNHLDMTSVEVLINALKEYEGTLLFVSHDRNFIDQVCTHVFAMVGDGRGALFEGQLDDYARLAELASFPNVLELNDTQKTKEVKEARPAAVKGIDQKERQKMTKEISRLESEIEKFKNMLTLIDSQMALVGTDYEAASKLQEECDDINAKLDRAEEKWLETCQKLEEMG